MPQFNAGNIIKKLRESKNVSQKKACERVCSEREFQRIEKGETLPTKFVFCGILKNLDADPEKYLAEFGADEMLGLEALGRLIRELRSSKDITQDELCKGICSKYEMSRIENGKTSPSQRVLRLIMERLGESPNMMFNSLVTSKEKRSHETKDKIRSILKERNKEMDARALKLIEELDCQDKVKSSDDRQFIFMARAMLAGNARDFDGVLKYATEALKITIPEFDEDKTGTYALTFDEIRLLNMLAVAHSQSSMVKSVEILFSLKAHLDQDYIYGEERGKIYLDVLLNITKCLGHLKDFERCMLLCDEGNEICIKRGDAYHRPRFMFNKSQSLLEIGQIKEGVALAKDAYALFRLHNYDNDAMKMKSYLEEEYGITIQA